MKLEPDQQRAFALQVVERLRAAKHEAYWAGGCVRDHLLERTPQDYDVATGATPAEVREIFGHRRTLLVGASFGVAAVVGPRGAGTVEVTTFRQDSTYSDGRHPDSVVFSSPREDALRRDFTINGMFYDPLDARVIDYVEGQADLEAGVVRAIGDPRARFSEDKLRILRAVRFAADFGFRIEDQTAAAIREMAATIVVVSPERIAQEMRKMLCAPTRGEALTLLSSSPLLAAVLPELSPSPDGDSVDSASLQATIARLSALQGESFGAALAALLLGARGADQPKLLLEKLANRWRLANKDRDLAAWILGHLKQIQEAPRLRWSQLQPVLVHEGVDELLAVAEATAADDPSIREAATFCRERLTWQREKLDPRPLISGDDLLEHGVPRGKIYAVLLARVRAAQLDGEVRSREEALALVDRLRQEGDL